MKRKFLLILVVSILLFSGCDKKAEYDFINDTSTITSISIVELNSDGQTWSDEKELCTIVDIDSFINEFKMIECTKVSGEPHSLYEGDVVVKIVYLNDEYEWIHWYAQKKFRLSFSSYGYRMLDKEQYNNLIQKYYGKTD